MIKMISSVMLMGISAFLLTATFLSAEECNTNERTQIGIRAKSTEDHATWLQARAKMAILYPEEFAAESAPNDVKATPKNMKSMKMAPSAYAKSMYYTTHPAVYQNPVSISFFGDSIELMDGSLWTVSSSDAYKATSWYSSDLLVITPNHSWFSFYSFRLTNQSTGESVAANLTLGPIAPGYGRYTHWIVAMDYYYNIVYLEDNSVWDMSSFDSNIVNQWAVGDVVMIGVNDGWLSGSKPNVLINLAMLNFAAGAVSF